MGCGCRGRVYGQKPKKRPECLCINDLRVGCNKGPAPCGGTMEIDLTEYNDVTASPCEVVYILKSFDKKAFSDVRLSEDGTLYIETSNSYKQSEEFEIVYKVTSPCSILSDEATVYICMKNLCMDVFCNDGKCDQCTGECVPDAPEINVYNSPNKEIILR